MSPSISAPVAGPMQYGPFEPSASSSHRGQSDCRIHKHHRKTSTGGGRAWTEEEEAYLLRTRLHKMPYKHIATHLKKTELACRLHYHQMSYGSNRRKRTDSVSSTGSYSSYVGPRDEILENATYTRLSPVPSPPSSPEYGPGKSLICESNCQQSRAHVPILPKPDSSAVRSFQSTPADMLKSLRLDTSFTTTQPYRHQMQSIQVSPVRLRAIYDAHRDSFWSLIASEYSQGVSFSPRQLEEAFFNTTLPPTTIRAPSPPTPGSSPRDTASAIYHPLNQSVFHAAGSRGFQAVNGSSQAPTRTASPAVSTPSSVERCAVSALLTVEKEVRPSRDTCLETNA
ncbi:hypothetical protein DTO271D3_6133 [Paecilomyces variotii]|nr:hypothetical protein DTO271D3_6133 [Paecilomyces variotii]